MRFVHLLRGLVIGILPRGTSQLSSSESAFNEWSGWGANYYNNRWAQQNTAVSSSSIQSLTSHCTISYPIGLSATPVISGDAVYYPTWNGSFVALDYLRCQILWEINVTAIIASYSPITALQMDLMHPVSRTSPQVDGDIIFFGTLANALLVAVNRLTGEALGMVQVNPHPVAVVTMSPTLYNGKIFIGSSSYEANATPLPGYVCCTFVGNFAAFTFDPLTSKFQVLWNITMIPEAQAAMGWAGAGVWGSQPAIDAARGQVFIGTGNTYSIPEVIIACQNITQNISAVLKGYISDSCLPLSVWQESVMAIDIDLGVINWIHQLSPLDAFVAACGVPGIFPKNPVVCPHIEGPDADFGMAPAFVPGSRSTPQGKDTLVIGQKNGNLYAMSAETGYLFWTTTTSPNGDEGGLSWGIAVDDSLVYFTAINSQEKTFQLYPSNQMHNRSAYGATSLSDGTILWTVASPSNGVAYGPPTVVGDLVLVGKTGTDPNGTGNFDATPGSLVAIEKVTGNVVNVLELDSNFHGGVAVQGDYVFCGTGYSFLSSGLPNGSLNVMRVQG